MSNVSQQTPTSAPANYPNQQEYFQHMYAAGYYGQFGYNSAPVRPVDLKMRFNHGMSKEEAKHAREEESRRFQEAKTMAKEKAERARDLEMKEFERKKQEKQARDLALKEKAERKQEKQARDLALKEKAERKKQEKRMNADLRKAGLDFIQKEYPKSTLLGPVRQHTDPPLPFVVRSDILACWDSLSNEYGQEVADLVKIHETLLDVCERVKKNHLFEFEEYLDKQFKTQKRVLDQVGRRNELRDKTGKMFDKVANSAAGFRMIRDGQMSTDQVKAEYEMCNSDAYRNARKRVRNEIVEDAVKDAPFAKKSTLLSTTDRSIEALHKLTMKEMEKEATS